MSSPSHIDGLHADWCSFAQTQVCRQILPVEVKGEGDFIPRTEDVIVGRLFIDLQLRIRRKRYCAEDGSAWIRMISISSRGIFARSACWSYAGASRPRRSAWSYCSNARIR